MTYAEKHERATADFLDNVDGDKRSHKVLRAVASSQQLRVVVLVKINLAVQERCLRAVSVSTK